jgi:hypothetical protein
LQFTLLLIFSVPKRGSIEEGGGGGRGQSPTLGGRGRRKKVQMLNFAEKIILSWINFLKFSLINLKLFNFLIN